MSRPSRSTARRECSGVTTAGNCQEMDGRPRVGRFSRSFECVDLALGILNHALDEGSEIVVQPEARIGNARYDCLFRQFWRDGVKPWKCSASLARRCWRQALTQATRLSTVDYPFSCAMKARPAGPGGASLRNTTLIGMSTSRATPSTRILINVPSSRSALTMCKGICPQPRPALRNA